MKCLGTFLLVAAFLFPALLPSSAQGGIAVGPETCLKCHDDRIDLDAYSASVHGRNACTACHLEVGDLQEHAAGQRMIAPVNCVPCHKQEAAMNFSSVHALKGGGCIDCHEGIHTLQKWWPQDKKSVVATCVQCHQAEDYRQSIHGRAVERDKYDAPACHDCHSLHAVQSVSKMNDNERHDFHTRSCIPCHSDKEKMARNNVFPNAVETFVDSYHGKSYRLGFPRYTAGCADCHEAHRVLPEEDPRSSLNIDNRAVTCAKCHPKATPLFARFYAHGDPHDRQNYPVLYWTYLGMTALLVVVFFFFWVHTLLWMFRGFVENREKIAAQTRGEVPVIPDGMKQYRRFKKGYVFLHLVVIVSFLGLSLTGLPLKFSNQEWAKAMMSFYGGVKYAGLLHRACAVLTFYYFFAAILISLKFLFTPRPGCDSWLSRLFGPDSLMPNFRDLQDIRGMIRWFLFRGPKPKFERWTYWEKFDFFAVFWGMFAIGGSGLILWFPEFFGQLFPGWMFNVATIIHSDEALLATGFIFTVHFFNTHGRPEKFPMDFVIFNGQVTKADMMEERTDQWERLKQAGIIEQFRVQKPSGVFYDFFFKGFGFLALLTGLAMAFLMVYAFIRG